jgi:hypothetical protein
MDPETKRLLEENLRLSQENNLMLIKVRNYLKWAQITKAFYWLLIIGISVGAFYFIKPYFGSLLNIYSGDISGLKGITSITTEGDSLDIMKSLLNQLNKKD